MAGIQQIPEDKGREERGRWSGESESAQSIRETRVQQTIGLQGDQTAGRLKLEGSLPPFCSVFLVFESLPHITLWSRPACSYLASSHWSLRSDKQKCGWAKGETLGQESGVPGTRPGEAWLEASIASCSKWGW